jgi:hypothetical protein
LLEPIVFYTEPYSYRFPKKGLFSSYHEAEGPITISEVEGFSGIKGRTKMNVLVVQMGFEAASLDEIIFDLGPKESILINGFPSYAGFQSENKPFYLWFILMPT